MSVIFVESWSNKFFVSIKHISSMNECRTNRFTIYYGDNPRFWEEFVLWWCQKSVRQSVPDSCAHLSPFFAEILLFEKKKTEIAWKRRKMKENVTLEFSRQKLPKKFLLSWVILHEIEFSCKKWSNFSAYFFVIFWRKNPKSF